MVEEIKKMFDEFNDQVKKEAGSVDLINVYVKRESPYLFMDEYEENVEGSAGNIMANIIDKMAELCEKNKIDIVAHRKALARYNELRSIP